MPARCVCLLSLLLATCSREPSEHAVVAAVRGFAQRACACPDVACARQVQEEFRNWKMGPAAVKRKDLANADFSTLAALEKRLHGCAYRDLPAAPAGLVAPPTAGALTGSAVGAGTAP